MTFKACGGFDVMIQNDCDLKLQLSEVAKYI